MITLFGFGAGFGLPEMSPFVTKTEVQLRMAGLVAWFMWLVLHLMFLIGFRNRLVVGFQWLVYFTTFQRGARLITFDDTSRPM